MAKAKASCPRLRFKVIKRIGFAPVVGGRTPQLRRIEARTPEQRTKDKPIGAITIYYNYGGPDDGWAPRVTHVLVDEAFHRCGIGTKLYEQAAKLVCKEFKQPLQSDAERNKASQAFWEKQARKGRAKCLARAAPRNPIDDETPTVGRGGCYRYGLVGCPAPKSLAAGRVGGRD